MVGTAGPEPSAAFVRNTHPSARFFHPKTAPRPFRRIFCNFHIVMGWRWGIYLPLPLF